MATQKDSKQLKKKVYKKLDASPFAASIASDSLSALAKSQQSPQKKIIPSSASNGLREDFKKIFLPLLIDVFELRQMIENCEKEKDISALMKKISRSPEEILSRLEELQNAIEEAQRWCDGVIVQIAKGIQEAKQTLADLPKKTRPKKSSLIKRLFKK